MARRRLSNPGLGELLEGNLDVQADYRAAKRETKLRPRKRGVPSDGAPADYHTRHEQDWLWMGELGAAMDRDDVVAIQLLNTFQRNILQENGFGYDPQTGDPKLDAELVEWWKETANTPQLIDDQGQWTLARLAKFVLRATICSGDIFVVFTEDGTLELKEFHRCRSPHRHSGDPAIVHGVEMDSRRRRKAYYFTKEPVDPLGRQTIKSSDLTRVAAYGDDGSPNVLHVYDPSRVTQTRGVTVFAPVFDYLGIHDDLQFQQLVRSQISNMLLFVRQRSEAFHPDWLKATPKVGVGSQVGNTVDSLIENLYPGAELRGLPGEEIAPWNPNMPNPQFFDHMRFILRLIGLSNGLPYVLLMLDTSDTTFHGYRGAMNEAQMTFRCIQQFMAERFYTPVLLNFLNRLADEDASIGRRRDRTLQQKRGRVNLFRHAWKRPGWKSVDPLKDASADLIQDAHMLTSPRRRCAERHCSWDEVFSEFVDDRYAAFDYALERAAELMLKHSLQVTPGDLERWAIRLAPMAMPERTQLSLNVADTPEPPTAAAGDADQ